MYKSELQAKIYVYNTIEMTRLRSKRGTKLTKRKKTADFGFTMCKLVGTKVIGKWVSE